MKAFWIKILRKYIVTEIPTALSYCEFDCRHLSCEGCPLLTETFPSPPFEPSIPLSATDSLLKPNSG